MSDAAAIKAVTKILSEKLRIYLQESIELLPPSERPGGGFEVTTYPLDRSNEENNGKNRLNLFLYQTQVDPHLRNMDIPNLKEIGRPALAINLYYLITAYGEDNKFDDHLLLGQVMSALHDHPVLSREEIKKSSEARGLHEQHELVRITPQPMSVDEMSKLWTTFQTQYRISAAYEASVILIDSELERRSPLPVLKRGTDDHGTYVLPAASPLLRTVSPVMHDVDVDPPPELPSAELGTVLRIEGERLDVGEVKVRFRYLRTSEKIDELQPLANSTASEIKVKIPDDAPALGKWPAGAYGLSLIVKRKELPVPWQTNEIPFVLAPQITIDQPPPNGTAAPGDVDITLTCRPQIREDQERNVRLLFDRHQVTPAKITTPANPNPPPKYDPKKTTELEFQIKDVEKGSYVVRLRVDGVDSLPLKWTKKDGFEFDPAQMVTVQ